MSRIELDRKCCTCGPCPSNARGFRGWWVGGSAHILVNYDREFAVVKMGLSLELSGIGAVSTMAASGNPLFAGPTLSLAKRTPWDERVRPPICSQGKLKVRWPGI